MMRLFAARVNNKFMTFDNYNCLNLLVLVFLTTVTTKQQKPRGSLVTPIAGSKRYSLGRTRPSHPSTSPTQYLRSTKRAPPRESASHPASSDTQRRAHSAHREEHHGGRLRKTLPLQGRESSGLRLGCLRSKRCCDGETRRRSRPCPPD